MKRKVLQIKNILNGGILYSYFFIRGWKDDEPESYIILSKMKFSDNDIRSNKIRIFTSYSSAVQFYEKLCKNLATPSNLPYLAEDDFQIQDFSKVHH